VPVHSGLNIKKKSRLNIIKKKEKQNGTEKKRKKREKKPRGIRLHLGVTKERSTPLFYKISVQ